MRTALHVIGMLLLGCATLALAGAGYAWRVSRPLPPVDDATTAVGTSGSLVLPPDNGSRSPSFPAPLSGIHADLQLFAAELSTRRADAVAALDAAYRVSRVLRAAAVDAAAVEAIAGGVADARRALQNGDAAEARRLARRAAGLAALPQPLALRPAADLDRYVGGVLLTAEGTRVGTIRAVGNGRLLVSTGWLQDLLGLIALPDGATEAFAAADLAFGNPDTGEPMVVVARRFQTR